MTDGCSITVWPDLADEGWRHATREQRCGRPLALGARFCAKHEADRIRLGGVA